MSQADRQSVRRLRWMMLGVEMTREVGEEKESSRDRLCEKAMFSVLSGRPVER